MKGNDGYIRDATNNGAVLNTDNAALNAYKTQKKKFKELNELKSNFNDINNLKDEVKEIKNLLSTILEKLNK
jgi:hypothetical protein